MNVDPDRLRSYNLSPQDVVNAIDSGNYISPSGNVTIKDQLTIVPSNTMVIDPQELRNVPLKLGENVYIRDVGTVIDATDIPVGYALVNGKKSVYSAGRQAGFGVDAFGCERDQGKHAKVSGRTAG